MKEARHTEEDRKSWFAPEGFSRVEDAKIVPEEREAIVSLPLAEVAREVVKVEAGAVMSGTESRLALVKDPGPAVVIIGPGPKLNRTATYRIRNAAWIVGGRLNTTEDVTLSGSSIGVAWPEGGNPIDCVPADGVVADRLDRLHSTRISAKIETFEEADLYRKIVELLDGSEWSGDQLSVMMGEGISRAAAASGAVAFLFDIIDDEALPRAYVSKWLARVGDALEITGDLVGPLFLDVLRESLHDHFDGLTVAELREAVDALLPDVLMAGE